MKNRPLFSVHDSPIQYDGLTPGMHTYNCKDRFHIETAREYMATGDLSNSAAFCNGAFLGAILPYYIHNANNLMVGVLGNLDLAGMFMPNVDKVQPKLAGARAATGSVVEFFRDIAESLPSEESRFFGRDEVEKALTLLRTACGRSVLLEGMEGLLPAKPFPCKSPAKAQAALNGMATWTLLSLGGSGLITGSLKKNRLTFKWSRPEGSGLPYMPGRANCTSVIAVAGGLAASAGMSLVVENWTDIEGEVSLVAGE